MNYEINKSDYDLISKKIIELGMTHINDIVKKLPSSVKTNGQDVEVQGISHDKSDLYRPSVEVRIGEQSIYAPRTNNIWIEVPPALAFLYFKNRITEEQLKYFISYEFIHEYSHYLRLRALGGKAQWFQRISEKESEEEEETQNLAWSILKELEIIEECKLEYCNIFDSIEHIKIMVM